MESWYDMQAADGAWMDNGSFRESGTLVGSNRTLDTRQCLVLLRETRGPSTICRLDAPWTIGYGMKVGKQ